MRIGRREIGVGQAPYVIAEIGVNHDGLVSRALELTDAAAEAGADAVKLQYFETDRLMSRAAKLAAYQKAAGETDPVAMLRRLELPLDEMALVVDRAHERGLHAIVTVFSVELVEPAAELAWDAFKSASPDVVNRPLLEALAGTGRPMIVSTGASTLEEVVRARGWLEGVKDRLAFLQCVSSYPAPEAGLEAMGTIGERTGAVVGYSDHTERVETGREAAAAGAALLERHITHDERASGPDHAASLNPVRFAAYVGMLPGVVGEPLRGGAKRVLECERDVREVSRQSVVTTRALAAGDVLLRADLTIKRPGTGIEPWRIGEVVGRRATRAVEADVPVMEDDLEG